MGFFANDNDVVLAGSGIQLQEFLASNGQYAQRSREVFYATAYMKLMPTMPRPTTTTLFRAPTAMVLWVTDSINQRI